MNDNTVIQSAPGHAVDSGQQALAVGTRIEDFEIRHVIGVGGFGIVYEAWDTMLQRPVALKEYLPATLAQRLPNGQVQIREDRQQNTFDAGMRSFINEARLLAQFDHAALVKVYRFWEMTGTAYMVMPMYRGMTLKQHMELHHAPLEEHQLQLWLVALTEALEVMHAQQCYHRDISPENIIVQEGSQLPILLDFGAARRTICHVSQPFTVILKASYAPIEQYAEVPSLTQGPWTDVYALAAVAHFLITGKTPPLSVARMVNDSYEPLARMENLAFGNQLKSTIDRALAVQPQDRIQTMREFRESLLKNPVDVLELFAAPAAMHESPVAGASQDNSTGAARGKAIIDKRLAGWAAGACLLLLLGFSGLMSRQREEPALVKPVEVLTEETGQMESPTDMPTNIEPAFEAVISRADSGLSLRMDSTVLKIGQDLLRFGVESPIAGFVAVYVRSSDNTLIQLLPNARVPAIAIEANKLLMLPPANEPVQASGPAGINQFLVVVTEKPRGYDHLDFEDHYGFGLIQRAGIKKSTAGLEGESPCIKSACKDQMAAGWFYVEEVD